jgi:hypothetical protein
MTKIMIDATLPDKLSTLTQAVDLCDAWGRVLGRYIPKLDPTEYVLEPQISDAEIERRLQDKSQSYTTAEVLAHLEKL